MTVRFLVSSEPERRAGAARLGWLAVALVAGIAACAEPEVDAPARMFRLDARRSGAYPPQAETMSGKVAWTFATGGAVRSSPVVYGDLVVVGSGDGSLYALDQRTGTERALIVARPAPRDHLTNGHQPEVR